VRSASPPVYLMLVRNCCCKCCRSREYCIKPVIHLWYLSCLIITDIFNVKNTLLTWIKPNTLNRPQPIQAVTVRMRSVKEAGADTPPTYRQPCRNYMSCTLKNVTGQGSCSIQRRLIQWAVAREVKWTVEKSAVELAGTANKLTMKTLDPMTKVFRRRTTPCVWRRKAIARQQLWDRRQIKKTTERNKDAASVVWLI